LTGDAEKNDRYFPPIVWRERAEFLQRLVWDISCFNVFFHTLAITWSLCRTQMNAFGMALKVVKTKASQATSKTTQQAIAATVRSSFAYPSCSS